MKKGFTLMELMAVIIILALLSVLMIPNILNVVNGKREEISIVTENLIYDATELYVSDNEDKYSKIEGNIYCVKLEELVNDNRLSSPIKDSKTGKEIPLSKFVQVTVVNRFNLEYELVDKCEINNKTFYDVVKTGDYIKLNPYRTEYVLSSDSEYESKIYIWIVETKNTDETITVHLEEDSTKKITLNKGLSPTGSGTKDDPWILK